MSLVPCPSCNTEISSAAKKCPKCGHIGASLKTANCKTCHKPLVIETQYKSYAIIQNGHSGGSSPVMQACPHCGDPEPFSAVDHAIHGPMTSNKMALVVIVGFVLIASLLLSNVK